LLYDYSYVIVSVMHPRFRWWTMIHYLYFAAVLTLKQRAWTAWVQRSGDCLSKDQTVYLTTRL